MNQIRLLSIVVIISFLLPSCATVLGGKITSCQVKKEAPRQPRVGFIVADVLFGVVPLGVDFLTKAIYKPCK